MPINYNKPPKQPAPAQPPPPPAAPPPPPPYEQQPPAPPTYEQQPLPPPPPYQHQPPPPPSYPPQAPPYQQQPYQQQPPTPYQSPPPPPPSYPPPPAYPPQAPPYQQQPYQQQPPTPYQSPPPPPPYQPPPAQPYQQQPPAPPQGPPVSLSKVTLTKQAPAVSLSKGGSAAGVIRANLNWTQRQAGAGGFFKRLAASGGDVDLDLGCLFEFVDGDKGVVQALGNQFEVSPLGGGPKIIWLSGDDRSGASQGGEDLFIDLSQANHIRRILIFAYIYEGTPNWAAANAVVTVFPQSGPQIEVRLDEHDPGARMCAIAMLTNNNGDISINREVRYIRGGQSLLDKTYGWGMDWTPGRK